MKTNTGVNHTDNPKRNERIFFLCDHCLWSMTSLDKTHLDDILGKDNLCPICTQDELSSFPLMANDSFTYTRSKNRGVEINFGIVK